VGQLIFGAAMKKPSFALCMRLHIDLYLAGNMML
jgi:hypothetical protein